MTNRNDFIKYLQSLPEDTKINVLIRHQEKISYQGDSYYFDDLDINENIEFFKEDKNGPPVLYLGED